MIQAASFFWFIVCVAAFGQADGFQVAPPTEDQTVPNLTVGGVTYEAVALTAYRDGIVTFSHAVGNKSLPMTAFNQRQLDAMQATSPKIVIRPVSFVLGPILIGDENRAVELVRQAGDVNGLLPNGNTPLIEASSKGWVDVARSLIARDADLNLKTRDDRTALSTAIQARQRRMIELLRVSGLKPSDLMSAIVMGDAASVGTIVGKNKNLLKGIDGEGMTPLLRAAAEGQQAVVSTLLAAGAEVDERDASGRTAAMIAAGRGDLDMLQALRQRSADLNATDPSGRTPLLHAAAAGQVGSMEFLAGQGMKLDFRSSTGETAMDLAVKNGHTNVVSFLNLQIAKAAAPQMDSSVTNKTASGDVKSAKKRDLKPKALPEAASKLPAATKKQKDAVETTPAKTAGKKRPSKGMVLLVFSGIFVWAVGHIWMMVVGFQQSPFWTVAMFLTNPIAGFLFVIMHPREGWLSFGIMMMGVAIFYGVPAMYGMAPVQFLTAA